MSVKKHFSFYLCCGGDSVNLYTYSGPVSYYDKVLANNWTAETRAVSELKAISNFKYQFKDYAKMVSSVGGVQLHGKIKTVE